MRALTLKRVNNSVQGKAGVLIENEIPLMLTLERPWINNHDSISCIPEGSYVCKRIVSPKFGDTFQVTDVEGRSEILFHKGNTIEDSHGCILLGSSFAQFKTGFGIANSAMAYEMFMGLMKKENSFALTIISTIG